MTIAPETLNKAVEAAIIANANHKGRFFNLPPLDGIDLVKKPISAKAYEELYAGFEATVKAALEVVEREAWQPIETVPENVKLVLKYKDSDECVYPCVVFNDVDGDAQKLVSYPNELHGECDELSDFSHFMHLPQLPKEG